MRFKDILGHSKQIEALKRAVESGRVAHAYIFAGPAGVGKKRAALAFASAINCENFNNDACGECPSCLAASSGAHPNIITVEPENGTLKIGQIRELQGLLKYTVEKGRRVAIIEGVELMVRDIANVLLKTLEEPPAGSVIILVSSRPDSLLLTIRSRCQRLSFSPLKQDLIAGFLSSEKGLDKELSGFIARLSGGSLAKALAGADLKGIQEKRKTLFERLENLTAADVPAVLDFAAELSKLPALDSTLELIKTYIRDRIVFASGCPELVINRDMTGLFDKKNPGDGPRHGAGGTKRLIDSFEVAESTLMNITPPRTGNKLLALEAFLISFLKNTSPESTGTETGKW